MNQIFEQFPFLGGVALALFMSLFATGIILISAARYLRRQAGIDNDHIFKSSLLNRGLPGIILMLVLFSLYTVIFLGDRIQLNANGITLHDIFSNHVYYLLNPLSELLRAKPADNWFFYSTFYTFFVLCFGGRMIIKYRHNRYLILRTISVMFFQFGFGLLLPSLLILFKQPEHYFSYFWPLKYEYLWPGAWIKHQSTIDHTGIYFLGFGVLMTFIVTPIMTFFFGKRWYCSWVCGCGGLAETAGDPFRHLSNNSLRAWRFERWIIHGILLLVTLVTLLLWINSFSNGKLMGTMSQFLSEAYGFYIGIIFSGIVGVGVYPLWGNRVWCRFGCPLAAILGILQRFASRFRITTNGAQCISCGNCSVYCEMGIDVRWYAQRGQNIVRASCVGCGICSAVCPRGVLRLENGSVSGRAEISARTTQQ